MKAFLECRETDALAMSDSGMNVIFIDIRPVLGLSKDKLVLTNK